MNYRLTYRRAKLTVLALAGVLGFASIASAVEARRASFAALHGVARSSASVERIPGIGRTELHRIAYEAIRRSLDEVVNALGSAGGDSFQLRMTMARQSSFPRSGADFDSN